MKEKILIVEYEESIRFTYRNFLEGAGYAVYVTENYGDAASFLMGMEMDLVFIDITLDDMAGMDLLRKIKAGKSNCQVIITTGRPTIETAAEAIRLGALDYMVKPIRQDVILRASSMAMKHKALADARDRYRRNMEAIFRSVKDGIVSVDKDMNVIEINDAISSICNIDREDAIGKGFPGLPFRCHAGCIDALNATMIQNKQMELDNLECGLQHLPDQIVSVSATPTLTKKGEYSGAVMLIRDQTRLVRLERSLKDHMEIDHFVGKSKEIQKVYAMIKVLASVNTSVLITGKVEPAKNWWPTPFTV